jgi:hypothetical protein
MTAGLNEGGVGGGVHWTDDPRFEVIVDVPVFRDAVSACAANAPRLAMSAEQFLAVAAAVIPIRGLSRLPQSARRGRGVALKLGLRTGESRDDQVPAPVGLAIATVLCSMVYHGQRVTSVEQGESGCTLVGEIPSDRKTFGGVLRVSVERLDSRRSTIQAAANIPGQLYDWGKSKQTLAALFADILALPESGMAAAGVVAILTAQGDN